MNAILSKYSKVLSILAASVFVVGCSSEDETVPDLQADGSDSTADAAAAGDEGVSADLIVVPDSEDTADTLIPPTSDGSAAAVDCSGTGGTCEAPCLAYYIQRYSPELDCVAATDEPRGSSSLPFVLCNAPDTPVGLAVSCYCDQQGVCGSIGVSLQLPPDSDWELCSDDVFEAVTSADFEQQFCPPGTFD